MNQTLIDRLGTARERLAAGESVRRGDMLALLDDARTALTDRNGLETAMEVMSVSEMEALRAIARALPDQDGGVIVSTRIATEVCTTRSMVLSTLRLMAAAGVLETRNMGMRGTRVRLRGMTRDQLVERVAAASHTG